LAGSDDGRVIAMMNDAGEVSVAAAEDLKVLANHSRLLGTRGITRHIALTPSGTALVTSGADGAIHVWSTRSGEELFARYEFLPSTTSDESWALVTNDGQYDGSPAGITQLYFADGWDLVPPPVKPTSGLAARRLIP
jgi:WD40 repeat protein